MEPASITQFQYMSSDNSFEAVAYATEQAFKERMKWFVFAQSDGSFVCSDLEHVHPFMGVPCIAELHGGNLPVKEE